MYTMKQTCEAVGMSYETLKFYCNEGLVPNVKRDANNRRIFSARDIEWIKGLICLKSCGMGVAEMREYVQLCILGEQSIPRRREILAKKREQLVKQIAETEASIAYIDRKQEFYQEVLSGETEYYSNLTDDNI